ncbi:stalk domain-containing protein [Paenibacillus sp. GYB003]
MRNGNTLVPLRFISESLGAHVSWEDESKTVKITTDTTRL